MPMPAPKRSDTFGGANVNHIGPIPEHGLPKTINVTSTFEETLKLHLALGQILAKLNGYNRAKREGKRAATVPGIYASRKRVVVREGRRRKVGAPPPPTLGDAAE